MGADDRAAEFPSAAQRMTLAYRPRRPWLLIVSALLFALLSGMLWTKWRDTRVRALELQAELKEVYAEAETLRTQATRAQQRIEQLERELRAAPAPHPRPATKSRSTR
jgi:type VI protein secretion system component VasK